MCVCVCVCVRVRVCMCVRQDTWSQHMQQRTAACSLASSGLPGGDDGAGGAGDAHLMGFGGGRGAPRAGGTREVDVAGSAGAGRGSTWT